MSTLSDSTAAAVNILAKPIGPLCNLSCEYCFYLEKTEMYPDRSDFRMSDTVLETYVERQIEAQPGPEIHFMWQGGEPTLMGLNFFKRVVALQERHAPTGRRITNALQSNGLAFTDDWGRFLHDNNFLVGLSLDGPADLHDGYRRDHLGRPTHARVLKSLEILQRHKVEVNAMATVNAVNEHHPLKVYRHLKGLGFRFMQFIPIVERVGVDGDLAGPPSLANGAAEAAENCRTADFCAEPRLYGDFMCAIFDEWIAKDVSRVFVQMFDVILAGTMGEPISLCLFAETCGRNPAMESNGDLYACDHFVYPQYRLGNICDGNLDEMVSAPQQRRFGQAKKSDLPRQCMNCADLSLCNGGCPKHRFARTKSGQAGLNHLCQGYRRIYSHTRPAMARMAELLRQRRPAVGIMTDAGHGNRKPGRNDPCQCGSGLKYKKCCAPR